MVMAIDISITPLTLVPADGPASHSLANEQAAHTLTLTLFRNDKMVDLIGTAQDALRYVRARRTPSPRARV